MAEIGAAIPKHLMLDNRDVKAKNVMGKDDFMKLLMTQMQHQDPLNPMDHKEMAANLAQFGALEQLTNIGSGIQSLKTGMNDDSKFALLGLIGKKVQASGNEVDFVAGQSVGLAYTSKDGVNPVKAAVYDPYGSLVREITLTSKDDLTRIVWDGKNSAGEEMSAGRYTFRINGVDKNGQGVDLSSELSGKVTGVDMSGPAPMLVVATDQGNTRLEVSRVRNVMVDNGEAEKKPMPVKAPELARSGDAPKAVIKPDLSQFIKAAQQADGDEVEVPEAPEISEPALVARPEAESAEEDDTPLRGFQNYVGGFNR